MFKAVTGHSTATALDVATEQVVEQCRAQLQAEEMPQAGIVFTSMMQDDYIPLLDALNAAFPSAQLVGCTADAELSGNVGLGEHSVAVVLFCSDTVTFAAGVAKHLDDDMDQAVADAIDDVKTGLDWEPELCILLPDGFQTFSRPIADCFQEVLGPDVAIVGGSSADNSQMTRAIQFFGNQALTCAASFLLVGGDVEFSFSSGHGWKPIGQFHTVTSSFGNLVQTIDHMPAADFLRHYLGHHLKFLHQFSLALFENRESRKFGLRGPVFLNEDGSVQFVGELPQGAQVKLTVFSRNDIISAAKITTGMAMARYNGSSPAAGLVFSCTTRRQILGTRSPEEATNIRELLGSVPFCGFYTLGEICPPAKGYSTRFLNSSIVVLLLGEKECEG